MTLARKLKSPLVLVLLIALGAAAATATAVDTSAERRHASEACEEGEDEGGTCSESCALIPQLPLGDLASLPIAPDSERVDLCMPSFSNPGSITNPLFPISDLHSVVLLGTVDGLPFRTETTLLPGTKTIQWAGKKVKTRISQYVAYLDGEIHEVALDFYAQADDGSVWYFGEYVFNFEDGLVADIDGTWIAGKDGPAAMIMPANPQVGNVYRPENSPGTVFEEVTVQHVGVTVSGPRGLVTGAIVVEELHMDGGTEPKIFAPGYGEFSTGDPSGDLEAVALAVPVDALLGPVPAAVMALFDGAGSVFEAAGDEDWAAAQNALDAMDAAWAAYQAGGGVPPMLAAQMDDALDLLADAVAAEDGSAARYASLDALIASLDFKLRYRPPPEIDLGRLAVWTERLILDSADEDAAAVAGDVATLQRIWDRVVHTVGGSDAREVNGLLRQLQRDAAAEDLEAAAEHAEELRELLAEL